VVDVQTALPLIVGSVISHIAVVVMVAVLTIVVMVVMRLMVAVMDMPVCVIRMDMNEKARERACRRC